MTIDTIRPDS